MWEDAEIVQLFIFYPSSTIKINKHVSGLFYVRMGPDGIASFHMWGQIKPRCQKIQTWYSEYKVPAFIDDLILLLLV